MRSRTRPPVPTLTRLPPPIVVPISVLLLTQPACEFCGHAKAVLEQLGQEFSLTVREVDLASPEGRRLALDHGVVFAPGILIDDALVSYGRPSQRRLHRLLTAHTSRR